MNRTLLKELWKSEELEAHIHGWDFSHIHDRYTEETDLPWDYKKIVQTYLKTENTLLDIDTGGGEFLRSLNHPPKLTSATEGYPPNVILCRKELLPLGIDFREASDYTRLPFADNSFDLIINRHGNFDPAELYRLLKKGGIFVTQQVGEDNDRELVELLLPGTPKPFSGLNLADQKQQFEMAGFSILQGEEAFRPIRFFDIGALVWFARIIEWEFPGFSVDRCFERLLKAQELLEQHGAVEGLIHRYLIVACK
ncbi:MAG: class I SAM-dependent methyltransferase [Clostridiales bacterium]|nr:class I SAM-dependent methyltransferase [Clostridiales bacterium]